MELLVTTSRSAGARAERRAARGAARCGTRPTPRGERGIGALLAAAPADVAYVVSRERDELVSAGGARLHVHGGMIVARLSSGREHPLIRAVTGGARVARVFDATLGLGGDALHIAAATGAAVPGAERSPAVFSLLEEGLTRLAGEGGVLAEAASAVSPRAAEAAEVLASFAPASVEVAYVDPMFPAPARAAPGFELLRSVAHRAPDPRSLLAAARRAAARVVAKVPRGGELPGAWRERHRGKACDYLVA